MFILGLRSAVNYVVEQVSEARESLSGLFWATVPEEPEIARHRSLLGRVIPETPPKNRDELNDYLTHFAPPGEPSTEDRPTLRVLDLTNISDLTDEDIQKLSPYFDDLYELSIKTDIIVSLSLPNATKVDVGGCTKLENLYAPSATKVYASKCTNLQKLDVPFATEVNARECTSLQELNVPLATHVYAEGCTSLQELNAPKATTVNAGGCTSLQELNAPEATTVSAWGCRSLQELNAPKATDVVACWCTSLQALNAQNLPLVEVLRLGGQGVRSLPVGIGTLATLKNLPLLENQDLTGIPMEILDLPSTCTVDISRCEFSESVRENLRRIVTAEGYQGPRFSYSMPREYSEQNRTNEEVLEDLFRLAGEKSETFHNLPGGDLDAGVFNVWLNRLFGMADYKAKGDRQKALSGNVLKYLRLADKDEEFRKVFGLILSEATATCGDRMALSILRLGLHHQLSMIDLNNVQELGDFLVRGIWAIDLLEGVAREKIPTLPFFDEVEVYLGYPVMLKERLQLPIDVEEMLYFRCSALKEEDLAQAAEVVEAKQRDEGAKLEFLVGQEKWKAALVHNYPKEMEEIEKKRDEDSESSEDPDYAAIDAKYKQALINLSKRALSN